MGMLHIKDLVKHSLKKHGGFDIRLLMRAVPTIPEDQPVETLLARFKRQKLHMGIVLDEFSGTDGLITLEDLLEEIVGEIEDEHSPVADIPKRGQQGEWLIAGGTAIAEVGELLEIDFEPGGVYTTLAGFIMAELGEIPKEGDSVAHQGYCFEVESMERFRIQTVRVQSLEPGVDSDPKV